MDSGSIKVAAPLLKGTPSGPCLAGLRHTGPGEANRGQRHPWRFGYAGHVVDLFGTRFGKGNLHYLDFASFPTRNLEEVREPSIVDLGA